jgi:hypothetical protein
MLLCDEGETILITARYVRLATIQAAMKTVGNPGAD